jgi:hypothetical protein
MITPALKIDQEVTEARLQNSTNDNCDKKE